MADGRSSGALHLDHRIALHPTAAFLETFPTLAQAFIASAGASTALPFPRCLHAPFREFALEPATAERLANLAGPFDGHLRRSNCAWAWRSPTAATCSASTGPQAAVGKAEKLLRAL